MREISHAMVPGNVKFGRDRTMKPEDLSKLMQSRVKAVELKCEEMAQWYLANNKGVPPREICEESKYGGSVMLRWMDPPIPGVTNPVLIESYVGDFWTLRYEPRTK